MSKLYQIPQNAQLNGDKIASVYIWYHEILINISLIFFLCYTEQATYIITLNISFQLHLQPFHFEKKICWIRDSCYKCYVFKCIFVACRHVYYKHYNRKLYIPEMIFFLLLIYFSVLKNYQLQRFKTSYFRECFLAFFVVLGMFSNVILTSIYMDYNQSLLLTNCRLWIGNNK